MQAPNSPIPAQEFVAHVKSHPMVDHAGWPKVEASLDAHLQSQTQSMFDQRLQALRGKNVHNGAVLALDHTTGEILVWVVAGKDGEHAWKIYRCGANAAPAGFGAETLPLCAGIGKGLDACDDHR